MTEPTYELPDLEDDRVKHLNIRYVLTHGPFKFLWYAQVLSQTAGHMLNFALVIQLYKLTNSNTIVSILVALISIPPVLFSSLAGVYADNFNRKYIMFISHSLRCVLVIAILLFGHHATLLLAAAFLISTISQFFGPSESASIASLVHRKGYFSANSLFVFTTYTAFLVGYSIAGPVIRVFGQTNIFIGLAVMFALAAFFNTLLPQLKDHLDHSKTRTTMQKAFGSFRKDMHEGLAFLRHNRFLLVIVLLASCVFAFERAIISLLPGLATKVFGYSLEELSYYVITPAGIGAFGGVIIANWLKLRVDKTKIIVSGMLIAAVTLMFFPLYHVASTLVAGRTDLITFVALLAFLSGFGDVFIIVAAQTLIHEETSAHNRGRVFGSLITLMNAIGLPLIVLVGFLANHFPPVNIVFAMGLFLTVLVVASLTTFRRVARSG